MPPYSIDDLIHGTFPSMSDTDRAILLDGALDDLRDGALDDLRADLRADHLQALDDLRADLRADHLQALDDIRKERDNLQAKFDRAERVLVAVRVWIASGDLLDRDPVCARDIDDAIGAYDLSDARHRAPENLRAKSRAKPSKKR